MEALSVRDYRNNLSSSFDRAEEGEKVIIRRKNKYFALISVGSEELELTKKKQKQIESIKAGLRRGLSEVQQIEANPTLAKSANDFLNEL